MVKVYQFAPLTMQWCVDCHKDPTPHLRDPANVTKMGYDDPKSVPHRASEEGQKVLQKNQVSPPTNCSTCHR